MLLVVLCLGSVVESAVAQSSPRPERAPGRRPGASPQKPPAPKSPPKQPKHAQGENDPAANPTKAPAAKSNTPVAQVPTPRRADAGPVDLADRDAYYRELADLASLTGTVLPASREPAVGWYPYPSPQVALERTVRFDHLMNCRDPEVTKTAGKLRQIVFDNWRLNRFEELYGDTLESRVGDFDAALSSQFRAALAMIVDSSQQQTDSYTFYDSAGAARTVTVARDMDYSLSEDARKAHTQFVNDLRANAIKFREVSAAANAARELLAEELLMLLDREITPNLPAAGNGDLALTFQGKHFSGPAYAGPSLRDARDGFDHGPLLCYDNVVFLQNNGASLHNFLAVFEIQDEYGLRLRDQRFVRVLEAGPVVFRPFGMHNGWLGHTTDAKINVRIQCDEGTWSVVEQPFLPNGASSDTVGRIPTDVRKKMREQAASEYPPLVIAAKAILHLARESFALPVNPVVAARALRPRLKAGDVYVGSFSDKGDAYTVTLTLDSLDEATGLYLGRTTYSGEGMTRDEKHVRGRLVEEVERGAAVGFCRYELEVKVDPRADAFDQGLERRLERLPAAEREAYRERLRDGKEKAKQSGYSRLQQSAQAWAAGAVWLIGSPYEIKRLKREQLTAKAFAVAMMGVRGQHYWGLGVEVERAQRAVCAEIGFYMSPDGELMMQSSVSPETREISESVAKRGK
ncbi:hypothetical protein BH11PLA1_BH11PLA1_11240 [soil metagenome]